MYFESKDDSCVFFINVFVNIITINDERYILSLTSVFYLCVPVLLMCTRSVLNRIVTSINGYEKTFYSKVLFYSQKNMRKIFK